jgi:hypothetical protein
MSTGIPLLARAALTFSDISGLIDSGIFEKSVFLINFLKAAKNPSVSISVTFPFSSIVKYYPRVLLISFAKV